VTGYITSKFLVLLPLLACAQDPREIVRRAVEIDTVNQQTARSYTFLERQEERQFDGAGKQKQRQVRTWDVTLLEGSPYRRLVARDDQPLSPAEQKKEEEKLSRSIEQRRKETPEQRDRRLADWDRRQQRQHEPLREMVDAFDFTLAGQEALNGGRAWVIDAAPKPGYKPQLASAAYFPKIKARLWISQGDYHWIKVEAETLDTIAFGGFLLRLAKGGHLLLEQTRVNNEVWLPKRISVNFTARLALVKGLRAALDLTFSDYKKFQVESRITSVEENR
jgi:hypothetical protein